MKKRIIAFLSALIMTAMLIPSSAFAANGQKLLALTFDDGPSCYTEELLDGLAERNAKATFFVIGEQIEGNEAILQRMKEEGHQIGNHSYNHAMLNKLSLNDAVQNIAQCDALLRQTLGDDTYWVRPPYGFVTDQECCAVAAPLIYWSIDTEDWSLRDAGKVAQEIIEQAEDGDIILLHDCYDTTVKAVMRAIDTLQEQDVEFVTVEELFARHNVTAQCGVLYKSGK